MVSDYRDRGCICDYYGGDCDLRRVRHKDCPMHGDGLIATMTSFDSDSKERMYHIPKGTYIARQSRVALQSPCWELFKTKRGVTYKEDSDKIQWPGGQFMFVPLPVAAAPYIYLAVVKESCWIHTPGELEQQLKNRTPGKYWNRPHQPSKQQRIKWRADIGARINDAINSRSLPDYCRNIK